LDTCRDRSGHTVHRIAFSDGEPQAREGSGGFWVALFGDFLHTVSGKPRIAFRLADFGIKRAPKKIKMEVVLLADLRKNGLEEVGSVKKGVLGRGVWHVGEG